MIDFTIYSEGLKNNIENARRNGIVIPTLCHHESLPVLVVDHVPGTRSEIPGTEYPKILVAGCDDGMV